MGTSKLKYYNNRYQGSLTDSQCQALEMLIKLKEDRGCVSDIVHSIYDMDAATVDDLIDTYFAMGCIPQEYEKGVGTLSDYQTISVAMMYYAGNCLLGDSVGMGKTVEISALFNILRKAKQGGKFRFLVLTEKKPVMQVRRELIRFTGEYCHVLENAEAKVISRFIANHPVDEELDYSVTGTHALIKSSSFLAWLEMYKQEQGVSPFDILVVDESQILSRSTTDTAKSFKIMSQYFSRIVMLNATPVEHNVMMFYTQLDLLDSKFLPTKVNFQKEYCEMDYRGMFPRQTGKCKNTNQLRSLIKYRYFASTRRENGARMNDCSGGIIVSKLSKRQKELLKESMLHRMIYDCPCTLDNSIAFNEENVPKLGSVRKLLENECKDALSVLLFVHFKEAQTYLSNWLHERGYSNRILNGDTPVKDSDTIINGFKNGEYQVLITNVMKSLNFGNCDHCIFYSVETNPGRMIQFEGRLTRSFDIYGKHVYILASEGKEYKNLNTVVTQRAKTMSEVSEVDYSVVLSILLGGNY